MAGKHGWNDLGDYLLVVRRVVDDDPFVVGDELDYQDSPEAGEVSGDIFCHGNIVVNMHKHLKIRTVGRGRRQARTTRYSYNARYEDGGVILRYDNSYRHPGHPTAHHKHEFHGDDETITHVGADWPHLSEVLDELRGLVWR
jgi:hypothetical protein